MLQVISTDHADPKSALAQFCQKFCQRPITKADIVYTTTKFGHQCQAIVKLNCLQGQQEFAGELCVDPKQAEKSAAQQVLKAYATTISTLPTSSIKDKDPKKRKVLTPAELAAKKAQAAEAAELGDGENPAITPKTKLNSLVMKIIKRYLQKGETVYECLKVPNGYQGTVKLAALPGEWTNRTWAGHVCSTKQKAEQSAAEIALNQIEADAALTEEAAKPKGGGKGGKTKGGKKGSIKGSIKGKGKGFGWGMPPWAWLWGPGPWGGPWGFDGSSGYGRPSSGPDLPRKQITESPVTGEVLEWKGKFGWLKPATALGNASESRRGGKVYVNQRDLKGVTELTVGATVTFSVYEDSSGLGAQDVSVL